MLTAANICQNTRDCGGSGSPYGRGASVWLPRRKHDLPPPRAPSFKPERSYLSLFNVSPGDKLCWPQLNYVRQQQQTHTHTNHYSSGAAKAACCYLSRGRGQPLWSSWQRRRHARRCEEPRAASSVHHRCLTSGTLTTPPQKHKITFCIINVIIIFQVTHVYAKLQIRNFTPTS